MENFLEQLNPAQREAVVNFDGPSLIVAGAGSGKTRVLTSRIAYMIASGIFPHNILALTFTNKAAAEMRERISEMVGHKARYIQMGTFHSIFLRILHFEAEKIGYPHSFTIYDTTDSQSLVRSICKEMGLTDNEKYKPRAIFAKISRLKNDLVTPAVYEADPVFKADDGHKGQGQFLEIYKRYTDRCRANGAMDFDDLLLNMVVLLKNNPDTLAKYRDTFKYILVDEYQDTNHVQYIIVKALAKLHGNICVVGDDSQSIYSFRGARIENIFNFRRDFPEAKVYKLEQNYRSTQTIVGAANSVIARNRSSQELKKECFSAGVKGEKIRLLSAYTDREEAEMVASEIRRLGRENVPWQEIAVLYRTNALSRVIEEALRRREVPYKIYRGHSFFDRKEIKDLLGYFRLIVNPSDDEAFKRVVNYPARGIGDVTVGRIAAFAAQRGISLWDAAQAMDDRKIIPFTQLINTLSLEKAHKTLYEFGREVAIQTGILGSFRAENTTESISALENIEELLNSMAVFATQIETSSAEESMLSEPTLEDWLQSVALMTDMDEHSGDKTEEDRNKVTLMTVHSAKGLEFRHVFIIGLEEELFPSVRSGETYDEIEEERRLFYVALTRAKERSYLSLAETRFIHGNMAFRRASRFVSEIDGKYLDSVVNTREEDQTPSRNNFGPRSGGWGQSGRPMWEKRIIREPGSIERVAPVAPPKHMQRVSASVGIAAGLPTEIAVGARVLHPKFGLGIVELVEPIAGGELKVTVSFDDTTAGRKTLLSKYAKLEVV